MFLTTNKQSGFSLVELLFVVVILVLISGILMLGFKNYASYQQFNQAVSSVEFELNQSRIDARSAVGDDAHGIKFDGSTITTFIGPTYSASNPTNESVLYELVTFTPNLTGGTDEIVFSKLTGLPSATGTIEIWGSQLTVSTTVGVSGSGVIQ